MCFSNVNTSKICAFGSNKSLRDVKLDCFLCVSSLLSWKIRNSFSAHFVQPMRRHIEFVNTLIFVCLHSFSLHSCFVYLYANIFSFTTHGAGKLYTLRPRWICVAFYVAVISVSLKSKLFMIFFRIYRNWSGWKGFFLVSLSLVCIQINISIGEWVNEKNRVNLHINSIAI